MTKSSKKPVETETPEQHQPSVLRSLTAEDLHKMLRPGWDPTKQWDGTPAMLDDPVVILPSRPPRRGSDQET